MSSHPLPASTRSLAPPGRAQPPLLALAREAFDDPARRPLLLGAAAASGLLVASFLPNILHFGLVWASDENYGHGFLVPLIALYFANEAARRGPIPWVGGDRLGLALIAASILGRLATTVVPVGVVGDLALLLGLAGVVTLLFGRGALGRFGFALAFLVFMVPLPVALYAKLATPLQLSVSSGAASALNLLGIPALREGNLITLPGDRRMFVAEACSGMRQLTGFLALTTAWAYLVARPAWYRAVLVASSIPIAMAANLIRVVLTGAVTYWVDPKFASGAFHTAEGLLMMGLGLVLLSAGGWVLDQVAGARGASRAEPSPIVEVARPPGPAGRVVLCVGLLGAGLVVDAGLEWGVRCERPPMKAGLATIPMRMGRWTGRDVPIEPGIVERSQADDWINRVYDDESRPGRSLSLWMNYSRTGLNMRHSPKVCLPSGGWTEVESASRAMEAAGTGGSRATLTRLAYAQGEMVQEVGFWYYIFGEDRVERWVRRLPITSRSSHGRTTRGSGLTVEVFCPGEDDPDGEALADFAAAILAELEPILPDDRASYHVP